MVTQAVFPEERRSKIMALTQRQGRCTVADLARELNVSEVTVRQDLDFLEKQGLLRRTHGGAILPSGSGMERPFQVVETAYKQEKERIAAAAAQMIQPGDTLILDVGTTVTELARQLLNYRNLTVFTNALNIAVLLEANSNITTVVTGGTLRPAQHSLVNPYAELILDKIHVDTVFLGVSGITVEAGLTNVNLAEAELKEVFIKAAQRRIVLADSSKVGTVALAKIANIQDVDLLITDTGADPDQIQSLQAEGLEVKVV